MKPGKGERMAQVLLAALKSGCYLALFLGAQVLVMLPVVIATIAQSMMGDGPPDEGLFAAMLNEQAMVYSLIANLLTLAVVLIFYLARRKKLGDALWLRRVDGPALWTGASLAPALYVVVISVLALLPEAWTESYSEASAGITTGGVVGVIAVALAAPVVEEIIFRGLIMTRLSRAMPGWLAVLLSAAVFGACHGNPVWFGYAFVLGAFFGLIDLRAGSIWPSILGHVVFNSISQILSIVPETEEGTELAAAMAVLLAVAIILPILGRKGIAALFRPRPKTVLVQEPFAMPGVYDFDPWAE